MCIRDSRREQHHAHALMPTHTAWCLMLERKLQSCLITCRSHQRKGEVLDQVKFKVKLSGRNVGCKCCNIEVMLCNRSKAFKNNEDVFVVPWGCVSYGWFQKNQFDITRKTLCMCTLGFQVPPPNLTPAFADNACCWESSARKSKKKIWYM